MRVMNPMNFKQTALERAFEIARAGQCNSVDRIRRQLALEGLNQFQIRGPALNRQLLGILRQNPAGRGRTPDDNRKGLHMDEDAGHDATAVFLISNAIQFREAISRLRFLENASKDSSLGAERDALELAVSRYLVLREEVS